MRTDLARDEFRGPTAIPMERRSPRGKAKRHQKSRHNQHPLNNGRDESFCWGVAE